MRTTTFGRALVKLVESSPLAPHTNGPRDVPRCEALRSLHSRPKGGSAEIVPGMYVKFCDLVRW
jgi:hypothetical protein